MSATAHAGDVQDDQGGGCGECVRLRDQVRRLTLISQDQARALSEITSECPPDAPSLACCYWLWSLARSSEPCWRMIHNRIAPLISSLGDLPAPMMSPLKWDAHRAMRRTQITKLGTPPCDQTLNIELLYAKQLLAWSVERGLIKRNPLTAAKRVKTISQRETRLTPGDVDRLLSAADDVVDGRLADGDDDGQRAAKLKAFTLACFDSFLRFNEARHLRFDRIREGGAVELLATETKSRRRRSIRLTPRTLEAISVIQRVPGSDYVFASEAGGLIGETTIRAWWRRACEISGVDERATLRDKQARCHDLRAGGASAADEAGARATAIKTALGHQSITTVERYLRSEAEENARHIAEVMVRATEEARRGPRRAPVRKKTRQSKFTR